jgi:hypothetical protein
MIHQSISTSSSKPAKKVIAAARCGLIAASVSLAMSVQPLRAVAVEIGVAKLRNTAPRCGSTAAPAAATAMTMKASERPRMPFPAVHAGEGDDGDVGGVEHGSIAISDQRVAAQDHAERRW